jgi:hypothetical protein
MLRFSTERNPTMPARTEYQVTVITDACVTRVSFPTAKLAALAALLACRAACDNPVAYTQETFLLRRSITRTAWSNGFGTAHVEVTRITRRA